jgi:hypothetical protein
MGKDNKRHISISNMIANQVMCKYKPGKFVVC